MIGKTYQYLFYKFYSWALNLHGQRGSPHQTAMGTITFLLFANVIGFLMILQVFTGIAFYKLVLPSKTAALILISIIWWINHFLFLRKQKYKKIFVEFQDEDRASRIKGNIFTGLYIMGTFLVVVVFALLSSHLNIE